MRKCKKNRDGTDKRPKVEYSSTQEVVPLFSSQKAEHKEVPNQGPDMAKLCIFTNNCRGYTSKQESIEKYVINVMRPDVINLSETLLKNQAKINQHDYFAFCQNRPGGAGGGGIATLVANYLKPNVTKVAANNVDDEFMITRFDHVKPALNIVHIYGRIEDKIGPKKVLEGWENIQQELLKIEARQEAVLMVGDMNKAVGSDEHGVRGNKSEISLGGSLIRNLVSSGKFHLLNNMNITTGGPWTRIYPAGGSPSCLDLALASDNLLPFVREVMVDSSRKFTPRRVVIGEGGSLVFKFTDHYPVVVVLEMPKDEGLKLKPEPHWNTHKPGAWEKYLVTSDEVAEMIESIVDDEGYDNEAVMNKVDKIQDKLKHKTFGKTKPKTNKAVNKEENVETNESEEGKVILKRISDKMVSAVAKVKETKNGKVTQIYNMKKVVSGSKKSTTEAQAIRNPETGELVVSTAEIKRISLEYCLKTLENNEPEEKARELIKFKEELHILRMKNREDEEEVVITDEDYFMTLAKFASKNSSTYDFITKAGLRFKLAFFKLCKRFIYNESFPSRFNLTTLVQLPKKGSAQWLENHRYLHIREWAVCLVEALTVRGMKPEIFSAGTKFQIGGCPGQRTTFHLFVVKSLIALKLKLGQALFLTLLDIIKYFDKQSLVDACDALYKAKVKRKLVRVWYKLNEAIEIQVRLGGGGMSARGLAGPCTGQGGGGSALASALNLDLGVQSYFSGSKDEETYGKIRLQPLSFVDDLIRANSDMNSMRAGNWKFSNLAAEKQLHYHSTKSGYLVYGSEQIKAKARLEAKDAPVMIGEMIVHEKNQEKYLGDILDSRGLVESVEATIKDREAKVKGSIYELRSIIEDFRMQAVGGFEAAIDLYESSIIPSLLNNCSTWLDIDRKCEDRLDEIQDLFCRVLLQVPKSTPKLALRGALGLLGMKWRVWEAKVLLHLAIQEQEDGGVAREVLEEQIRMEWPGLGMEVRNICKEVGLPDLTQSNTHADKEAIKQAIKYNHLKHLKAEMAKPSSKKLKLMAQSDMSKRRLYTKYSVEECRMAFRLETYMVDCRVNIPARYN